jgi:hypothetical protein
MWWSPKKSEPESVLKPEAPTPSTKPSLWGTQDVVTEQMNEMDFGVT